MLKGLTQPLSYSESRWFFIVASLFVVAASLSVILYNPLPLIIPIALIGAVFIIAKPRIFYYLFFFLLPFSMEIELPGGFGTDIPSEPLMLILMGVCVLYLVMNADKKMTNVIRHPISLLLILHLVWILFTSIYSTNQVFSIKFFLAKIWYVLPFYFLPLLLLRGVKDQSAVFKWFSIGLLISVSYVMLRHAGMGFGFDTINKAVRPIYRNHVNYGILLVAILPYLVYLIKTRKKLNGLVAYGSLMLLLLAIYLTYTRAAHISVVLGIGVYQVVKWRLAKQAILISMAGAILGLSYLAIDNNYLDHAPEYTKAIEHKKFDNLVEATTKMEDISTVERFYRWVAGFNMLKERPVTGFGPSTFYTNYKSYTVSSYKTYVSDNPEKSGIHNYYLMTAVEQGIPGLLIFIGFCMICILYGEKAYHQLVDKEEKALVMAATVCLVIILAVLIINDLLEADKVGPIFFLSASLIAFYSHRHRKSEPSALKP